MSKPVIEIPATEKHTATVIFLHGLMDTGEGWKGPIEMIKAAGGLNHIKFILPTAPIIPVSINFGMPGTAWFDIKSLNPGSMEDLVNLDKNMKYIDSLIEQEIKSGIPSNRIILGGFSQGAALSLYTGFQLESKLAAIVSLSGFIPSLGLPGKVRAENKDIPTFMFNGTADPVVNFKYGELSYKTLSKSDVKNIEFIPIPGLGHSANEEELKQVHDIFKKYLPSL
ncbi:hypothetical protein DICPUDRAFT_52810 [Dictyostelium purpureum]|uniref:Phospholipase/carboxylesterase/thioesterase domain-containing protein n=1 Tax=Dictyostelium purpureum TaxID=5786 RepID=F0ZA34_DICPU|nr:uncharacterized protein DICPUDRAFT_52810 [Dictyostelium purpureum]EGC39226.1 hypothetical protein DICPUDRAFT_52810 [Dictyostelium purpureum]|eukprot:XP_003284253.1 hypothetical protein DICPUDRAFT_52810 [Dictyostelium purpureum]